MGRLTAFVQVTVDGYFAGPNGELDFVKSVPRSADYDAYTHDQAEGGSTLVFGRTTYDMMKSYWPTAQAMKADPRMAKVVNESPKIVFSRELDEEPDEPNWKNVTIVDDIDEKDVEARKEAADSLTILGSGSIVQQLSDLGLIDEYCLVVVPVLLGDGKMLFEDVKKKELALIESRSFQNGLTVMRLEPRERP